MVNSHFAVINSRGRKVVLKKSRGNTAFVTIAALWYCPVRNIIPEDNPHKVSDHKKDKSKIPRTDAIPNWNVTPKAAPIIIRSIVKNNDDSVSAKIGAITKIHLGAGLK